MTVDILNVIGRATFDKDAWNAKFGGASSVMPASSNLLIELKSDDIVVGKFNDEAITLRGCTTPDICKLEDFQKAIQEQVYYKDMDAACSNMSDLALIQ